jgi:hypothetical protein
MPSEAATSDPSDCQLGAQPQEHLIDAAKDSLESVLHLLKLVPAEG